MLRLSVHWSTIAAFSEYRALRYGFARRQIRPVVLIR